MATRYVVLGSGMQGTACGYDLAKFTEGEIVMADISPETARKAAERINTLVGREAALSLGVDVSNYGALKEALRGAKVVISCVPYSFNYDVARAAVEAGVSMCDLGGNTDIVMKELKLDIEAKKAGISIVPDCGLMPGMGNTLAVMGMEMLEQPEKVKIRCGGLPQNPKGPLNYMLVFSIQGLINEYTGNAVIIRDGKVTSIPTLTEVEEIEFPEPVGKCEAFVTSGGSSTCPYTFEGKLLEYDYKTVRYKGHLEKIKTLNELGLFDLNPVDMGNGVKISPRQVLHRVIPPRITFPGEKDLVVLRVTVEGKTRGSQEKVQFDIMDFHDDVTGFSAMERTTAFPASIVAVMMASGRIEKGAIPLEKAVPPRPFVDELVKRGIELVITKTSHYRP